MSTNLRVLVLSPEPDIAESFIGTLCGQEASSGSVDIDGQAISLECFDIDLAYKSLAQLDINGANSVLILVHHLDSGTLGRITAAYARLAVESHVHSSFVIYRKKNEADFKISCPTCDQKLLVRDQDVNRMAKCPHCKNPLRLPLPDVLLRTHLNLPKSAAIMPANASRPDSCRHIFSSLADTANRRDEVVKSSTMRIVIPPEELAK